MEGLPDISSAGKEALAIIGGTTMTFATIGVFIPIIGPVIGAGFGAVIGGGVAIVKGVMEG